MAYLAIAFSAKAQLYQRPVSIFIIDQHRRRPPEPPAPTGSFRDVAQTTDFVEFCRKCRRYGTLGNLSQND
jgi:hypothetical protein